MSAATEHGGAAAMAMDSALRPSVAQRLHSALLALRFAGSRRLRWTRSGYVEPPAGELHGLPAAVAARIAVLAGLAGERYEQRYDRLNSLENYLYLDLMDRLRVLAGPDWPQGGRWLDLGSKHFWYAPVLRAMLCPGRLTGVEIEGYRIYRDGHSRRDYARHYLATLPDTHYRVMDAMDWHEPLDGISAFYPFLLPGTVLAWGLPLSVLRPRALFAHLARCLRPGGYLLMVNQGEDEWRRARALAELAGLRLIVEQGIEKPLLPRPAPPMLSLFRKLD